jgi:predicted PurR-regulated permease PerM
MDTFYLLAAACLIFLACFLAAKKLPRRLKPKRMLIVILISLLAYWLVWLLVSILSRSDALPNAQPFAPDTMLRKPCVFLAA